MAPWPTAGRKTWTSRAAGGEAEPLQAGKTEQGRADRPRFGFAQPRLDIAAQQLGLEVGPEPQRLSLTAQRGGAERRPDRQALDRIGIGRDKRVANVLA